MTSKYQWPANLACNDNNPEHMMGSLQNGHTCNPQQICGRERTDWYGDAHQLQEGQAESGLGAYTGGGNKKRFCRNNIKLNLQMEMGENNLKWQSFFPGTNWNNSMAHRENRTYALQPEDTSVMVTSFLHKAVLWKVEWKSGTNTVLILIHHSLYES